MSPRKKNEADNTNEEKAQVQEVVPDLTENPPTSTTTEELAKKEDVAPPPTDAVGDHVPEEPDYDEKATEYTVQGGDTIQSIAAHLNTTVTLLYAVNINAIEQAAQRSGRTTSGAGAYLPVGTVLVIPREE